MGQLRGAALLWRTQGIGALLSALRGAIYSSERVLRLVRKSGHEGPNREAHPSLSVRRLSVPELAAVRERTRGLPLAFYVDRIHGVSRPFVARWDGELAHVSWVFVCGDHTPDMTLAAREAEIRYSHTLPEFRGRGIYQAVIRQIAADLEAEGIRTIYAHVVESNTSSLRAFFASGFAISSRLRTVRAAGVPFVFLEKGSRSLPCGRPSS